MDFLDNYQKIISDSIEEFSFHQEPKTLYEPINYILSLGGKRLRPLMVMMACNAFGGDCKKAIKPSLAIEFFHNFTLMHDDIMDNAPMRRNKPTVHSKYNLNTAILSGDALFVKAYQFFEELEPELFKKCISVFSETAIILCEGQQYDIDFEEQKEVTFEEYLNMITAKTGVLGAAAFKIGAMIANADDKDAEAIYNFGKHIGIAFQIKDDYLDVFGDAEKFGKKQGGDIFENKKTCLYLLALENANEEEKRELLYWYGINTENVDKLYGVEKIFKRTKVDKLALELVKQHNLKAQEYLTKINLSEDKLNPFTELANYLLIRDT